MAPPFIAIMFKDRDAAVKIFERWRERFGTVDKEEEIHVGRDCQKFCVRA